MTTLKIPALWASNELYSAGPDAGSATKVDPSSNANGFVRGTGAAAQHVNFELHVLTSAARSALTSSLLKLRNQPPDNSITDTDESLAAIALHVAAAGGPRTLVVKTAQAFAVSDVEGAWLQGVPASMTSLVRSAATDGSRIVVIGAGGNRNSYTDNEGSSWTAGGSIGSDTLGEILWNPVAGKFACQRTSMISASTDATAWTSPGSIASDVAGGMGLLSSGVIVYLDSGSATLPAFRKQDAAQLGTTTNAATGGTVPNSANFDDPGYIAGNGGSLVYHVGRLSSGTSLQVSTSVDGASWAQLASISPPTGAAFSSRPRLLMCQTTGLLVIAAPISLNTVCLYASVNGTDWLGPVSAFPSVGTAGVAVANGRVFATYNDAIFASDGCGP